MEHILNKYETIIGLEVHVQLSTQSKAYCSDANLFGALPNTCTSPISLGHPGTLPKANKKFSSRWKKVEKLVKINNEEIKKLNINKLNYYWEKTKK